MRSPARRFCGNGTSTRAEREFLQALTLNPNYIQARCWYGLFFLQWTVGRLDEGLAQSGRRSRPIRCLPTSATVVSFALARSGALKQALGLCEDGRGTGSAVVSRTMGTGHRASLERPVRRSPRGPGDALGGVAQQDLGRRCGSFRRMQKSVDWRSACDLRRAAGAPRAEYVPPFVLAACESGARRPRSGNGFLCCRCGSAGRVAGAFPCVGARPRTAARRSRFADLIAAIQRTERTSVIERRSRACARIHVTLSRQSRSRPALRPPGRTGATCYTREVSGKTEASHTRSPSMPNTRHSESTTAMRIAGPAHFRRAADVMTEAGILAEVVLRAGRACRTTVRAALPRRRIAEESDAPSPLAAARCPSPGASGRHRPRADRRSTIGGSVGSAVQSVICPPRRRWLDALDEKRRESLGVFGVDLGQKLRQDRTPSADRDRPTVRVQVEVPEEGSEHVNVQIGMHRVRCVEPAEPVHHERDVVLSERRWVGLGSDTVDRPRPGTWTATAIACLAGSSSGRRARPRHGPGGAGRLQEGL